MALLKIILLHVAIQVIFLSTPVPCWLLMQFKGANPMAPHFHATRVTNVRFKEFWLLTNMPDDSEYQPLVTLTQFHLFSNDSECTHCKCTTKTGNNVSDVIHSN